MSELSLAALKPAAVPASSPSRAVTPAPASEPGNPRQQTGVRRPDDGAHADAGRGQAPAEREPTRAGETEARVEHGSSRAPGEDASAADTDDTPIAFANLLAARLDERPAPAPAALAAGVQAALAEAPAAGLLAGGNGLPPAALERAIARQGAAPAPLTALPAQAGAATAGSEAQVIATAMPDPAGVEGETESVDSAGRARATLALAGQAGDERRASAEPVTPGPARDAAGLAAVTAGADPAGSAQPGRLTALVEAPLGHARWSQAFSERVTWLVRDGGQLASLRLDPPQLGPVDVRVSVSNGETSLSFVSAHAPVREAIEAALPRLREMLGEQGLALGNVDVSGREARDEGAGERGRTAAAAAGAGAGDDEPVTAPAAQVRLPLGLLDQYA